MAKKPSEWFKKFFWQLYKVHYSIIGWIDFDWDLYIILSNNFDLDTSTSCILAHLFFHKNFYVSCLFTHTNESFNWIVKVYFCEQMILEIDKMITIKWVLHTYLVLVILLFETTFAALMQVCCKMPPTIAQCTMS